MLQKELLIRYRIVDCEIVFSTFKIYLDNSLCSVNEDKNVLVAESNGRKIGAVTCCPGNVVDEVGFSADTPEIFGVGVPNTKSRFCQKRFVA